MNVTRLSKPLALISLLTAVCTSADGLLAQEPAAVSYEIIRAVPYGAADTSQTVTIYVPDAAGRRSTSIFVVKYGSGDKIPLVQRFAAKGYPVFFANVRRRGVYPQPVEDAFCALAWVHTHAADYGADPNRIVALGHSGGAVLAAHLGTVDDRDRYLRDCSHRSTTGTWLLGVVSIAGIFDYRTEEEFGPLHNAYTPRYFGGTKEVVPAVWEEASPITWVDGSEPPFLVVHGTDDVMVLPRQSERSVSLLRDAGVDVELVLIPGVDHTRVLGEETYEAVDAFIARLDRAIESATPSIH